MPLSNNGFIISPSDTALAEARKILIDTYGPDVNLASSSPNGLLVQNIALAITRREADQAITIGSIDPNIAAGLQLDAICANLDIQRASATSSKATCQVTGLVGTTITAGAQVASTAGDVFAVDETVVIGGDGTGVVTVTSVVIGPIPAAAGTITKIITGINGWSTINNSSNGTVGTPATTDTQLRIARIEQLAISSAGSLPSIRAGASALKPISFYCTDNKTGSDIVVDGITILKNSVLLVIEGGTGDEAIAQMFYKKLSGGCAMSGSSSFTLAIPNSEQTFVAHWQVANSKTLSLNIVLKLGRTYPANLASYIASIINDPDIGFDFNVIGKYIDATQFIYILMSNGISPIVSLTFGVGTTTGLIQYTMPISDSLGSSISSDNVVISYV